ncbi:MAG: GTPase ObgE [Chitinivibrionales bacterium]|nr:GTPase ObgE [Chitinivibrionales bacterium]
MFIDETVITVKAGDGGNGCFSYQREKYKPRGRPNGGTGGRGGHIYLVGDANVHTLQDVSYHRSYKADRGEHGSGSDKEGRGGQDITIAIPLGTVIIDDESGTILYDCVEAEKKIIIARGGNGGRGNGDLANRYNKNPERAEPGQPGEEKRVRFILKTLADVGLVGRPNAGKSTFLSVISRARPKIADYPFTTKEPHLGIVRLNETASPFVVADIPGLIEGSHQGRGLGIQFLRHIERTRVLAILIESDAQDPLSQADSLLNEMNQYSALLSEKPKCFILTKTDLLSPDSITVPHGWFAISSATRQGIDEVLSHFSKLLNQE